jgi:F-box and WD-40 domain protein CDC4
MGSRENNQVYPLDPESGSNDAFFDMMGSSTNPESHQLQVDYTRKEALRSNQPRPPPTPTSGVPQSAPPSMANALPPSAPASPPTPAPSPTPYSRPRSWQQDEKDYIFNDFKQTFSRSSVAQQKLWLEALVDVCDIQLLSFVHQTISPRLKKDPFLVLPIELSYKVRLFALDVPSKRLEWLT